VAGVRVGYLEGKPVLFPTEEQLGESLIDLVVAGTEEAILMVEGEAKEVSEEVMLEALKVAHEAIKELCAFQREIFSVMPVPEKMTYTVPALLDTEVIQLQNLLDESLLEEKLFIFGKKAREHALSVYKKEILERFAELVPEEDQKEKNGLADAWIEGKIQQLMRRSIIEKRKRADGRTPESIRKILCETGILPRTHGSALFTRGETQSLGIVTLGGPDDVQMIDTIYEQSDKVFMLHYNFPAFSVGEVKGLRGLSRREVGHGHLAERSVKYVIPSLDTFPYTVRVVSEILESNGSSSMASICSASLALMDAGVPIKKHVAGVAMGMILEDDGVEILTDIMGMEDHLGDMDFKVAGTCDGITGFQMDVKVGGISSEVMKKALEQAKEARLYILGLMGTALSAPRAEVSPYAPMIVSLDIPVDSIGELIGPGGKTIKRITKDFEVDIDVDDLTGKVSISGTDREKTDLAYHYVKNLSTPLKIGEKYDGIITRVEKYGVFVEIAPGKIGLLHASNMGENVRDASTVMKIGDAVQVVINKIEPTGKLDLKRIIDGKVAVSTRSTSPNRPAKKPPYPRRRHTGGGFDAE
jgi:polyribonucleotide nucleotidyltransferase